METESSDVGAGLAGFLSIPGARAEPAEETTDWFVVTEGITVFPLLVGGGLQLQGPEGLRFSAHAGILPEAYLDVVHEVSERRVVTRSPPISFQPVENALIAQAAGWKPHPDRGLILGGYTLAALGGGLEGRSPERCNRSRFRGNLGSVDRTLMWPQPFICFRWRWVGNSCWSRESRFDPESGGCLRWTRNPMWSEPGTLSRVLWIPSTPWKQPHRTIWTKPSNATFIPSLSAWL